MINSTRIRARTPDAEKHSAQPYEIDIEALANLTETNVSFEVPSWTGTKEIWCPASASRLPEVKKLVALEIDRHKFKVMLDQRFLIIRTKATRDRENETYGTSESLAWIRAEEMHIGDRLYYPAYDRIRKDWNKQDKQTGLGFIAVNKLRVQELGDPVEVCKMSVSRYHHFLLPSGIIAAA